MSPFTADKVSMTGVWITKFGNVAIQQTCKRLTAKVQEATKCYLTMMEVMILLFSRAALCKYRYRPLMSYFTYMKQWQGMDLTIIMGEVTE